MKDKYSVCPISVDTRAFFFSKEAQEQFEAADENVKKKAMALLEMTVKQSMKRIEMDFIREALSDIFLRLEKLEEKSAKN